MVGFIARDLRRTVKLFHYDGLRPFVQERERTERPQKVRAFAQRGVCSVRAGTISVKSGVPDGSGGKPD